jgi:hypothetical protein
MRGRCVLWVALSVTGFSWLVGGLACPAWAEWTIETVDSGGNVGQFTSLALDRSGNPEVVGFVKTNFSVQLRWNGSVIEGRPSMPPMIPWQYTCQGVLLSSP